MTTTPYTFRRISEASLPEIKFLYEACFGLITSLDKLKAKYNTKAFGAEYIGYIAYAEDNSPAGYYGVFPIRVSHNGKLLLAAQSGDTMTHPNHQKKGLFVTLGKMAYELAYKEGIEFVYGFPSPNSHQGLIRLNWQFYGEMQDVKVLVKTLPLAGLAKTYPFLDSVYNSYLLSQIKPSTVDYHHFNHGQMFRVEKDEIFYQYKMAMGSVIADVGGVPVWLKIDGWLMVGDVLTNKVHNPSRFIENLKSLARRCGCRKIVFSASLGSPLFPLIQQFGEMQPSLPIGFLPIRNSYDFENMGISRLDYDTI